MSRLRNARARPTSIRRIAAVAGLLAMFAATATASAAEPAPLLTLDAGGHTDMISALIPAGPEELISASFDKTIRVWNWHTGRTVRILRGEAGLGRRGEIRCLTLSPDGRTLLAGGFFDDQEPGRHPIRMYAWPEGTIRGLLFAHDRPVHTLALSPKGDLLASGDQRGVVRLWRKAGDTFEHVAGLEAHTASVSKVVFDPAGTDLLVSTSADGTACFWTVGKDGLTLKTRIQPTGLPTVATAEFRPDGSVIAISGAQQMAAANGPYGEVAFFDRQAKKIGGSWSMQTGVRSLAFSPTGDRIALGCGYPGTDKRVLLMSFPEGKLLTQFRRHDDSVTGVAFLPEGLIASAGGQDNAIRIWNAQTDAPVATLTGGTRSVWSVGFSADGKKLLWGDRLANPDAVYGVDKYNDRGPLEFGFDLAVPDLLSPAQVAEEARTALRGTITHAGTPLTLTQGKTFQFLQFGEKGPPFGSQLSGDVVYGVTFLPLAKLANSAAPPVFVASSRATALFDPATGAQLKTLEGHSGYALAVAPSPRPEYAVSGGGDQTVRLWHLPTGRLLLSVFRSGVDWVAFTPEGHYAASPQGDRLVGWQVNRGEGRDPEHFVAAQFQKSLHRPDVIRNLLDAGSVALAVQKANADLGKPDRDVSVGNALPPVVTIVKPATKTVLDGDALVVQATASSRGGNPVTGMQLLIDGRPFDGQKGRKRFDATAGVVTAEWSAKLPPGLHQIAVQAESAVSKAVSAEIEVTSPRLADEDLEKPALYVFAVGISNYAQGELKLNFAAADALEIDRVFREKTGPLFRKVESRVLTDGQATEREIRKGFAWFQQQMTARDVGVLFFSGHGQKDGQGIFYLLPSDVDPESLSSTAVPEERLKSTVAATPGRVLVLLDACHAGAYAGDRRKGARPLLDDLARDLVNDDYGSIVMCSSMGREFSLESAEHKHGYFTLALTEGLSGKADQNRDGTVYLHELQFYLTERVKELTKGEQHPVVVNPGTIRSLPLSRP